MISYKLLIISLKPYIVEMSYLRNKSWKPECVASFNMDWRILYVISLEMLYIPLKRDI